ncbi:MAG TPA: NAD(P)H-binding protein [Thermoplasmata archaeon]|nr:NAD(P)H-binding protein [Thermoplasmata archaeon]
MASTPGAEQPLVAVVGGLTGLVGRALRAELAPDHRLRSIHRGAVPAERGTGVEVVEADAATVDDWRPLLRDVDTVVNVAWYRQARRAAFVRLADGLVRLVRAAEDEGVRRFVHLSVPAAPERLERDLPYLAEKRRVDRAVEASSLRYAIVRPTMLFGPRDRLLTVMLRTVRRYGRFPMFGDGEYHLSPLAVADLAAIVRREGEAGPRATVLAGGPRRWRYRDLTDLLFRSLGKTPRYLSLSPGGSVRLASLLETLGSSLLYRYEVEWLLSDRLGLDPYRGLDRPLAAVEPFLAAEAAAPSRP